MGLFLLLVALAACAIFATTVASVPAPPPLPIAYEHASPLPFRAQIGHLTRRARKFLFGKATVPAPTPGAKPITVGFYTPWSDDSATSLERHIDRLDWIAPATLSVDGTGALKIEDDARLAHILATALHRPLVVPVLQNTLDGEWQGDAAAAQLASPSRRHALEAQVSAYLDKTGYAASWSTSRPCPPPACRTCACSLASCARSWRPGTASSPSPCRSTIPNGRPAPSRKLPTGWC